MKPYRVERAHWQRRYLTELLTATGGNLIRARKIAGLDRQTLYRMIKRLGLTPTLMVIRKRDALEQLAGLRPPLRATA